MQLIAIYVHFSFYLVDCSCIYIIYIYMCTFCPQVVCRYFRQSLYSIKKSTKKVLRLSAVLKKNCVKLYCQ